MPEGEFYILSISSTLKICNSLPNSFLGVMHVCFDVKRITYTFMVLISIYLYNLMQIQMSYIDRLCVGLSSGIL